MKKFLSDFFLRGLVAGSFGPPVLAIIYWILGATSEITALSPHEVATGILTITLLALVVGGMTAIYRQEQLPLLCAILIHGGVLYADYLLMYILNSWIPRNWQAIGIFTAIFATGYALIWAVIYLTIRAKTERINKKLKA